MPRLARFSLATWLSTAVVVVVLSAVGAMVVMVEVFSREDARDDATALLGRVADDLRDRLDRDLGQRVESLRLLAAVDYLREPRDADAVRRLLDTARAQSPDLAWIGLADAGGHVLAATGRLREGDDVAGRAWFLAGRRQAHVSGLHADADLAARLPHRDGAAGYVDLALPVLAADGRLAGVLGAHLRWHWAEAARDAALATNTAPPGTELWILDAAGQALLAPAGGSPDAAPRIGAGRPRFVVEPIAGDRMFTALAGSDATGWTVVAREPESAALMHYGPLRLRTLEGGLLLLALFIPVAFVGGRRLTLPLRRLSQALGHAPADARVPEVAGYREVNHLAGVMRTLLDQLRGHKAELETVNASLEHRVDARTTELREANARLTDTQRRLTEITENLPALITYVDRDYRNQYANATLQAWTGIDPARAVGKPLVELMGAEKFARRKPDMDRAFAGERVVFTEEWSNADATRYIDVVYVPHQDADGKVIGLYGLSTDMTAVRHAEALLQRLARCDALTELPNRLAFSELMPRALGRARDSRRGLALLFLDVDRFKTINDTLGHAAGDEVLRQFAQRLRGCVRASDTVARLAGDEFVIALESLPSQEVAEGIARKILAAMAAPMVVDGREMTVGTSIGIALAPEGRGSPESLLADADRALYEVKRGGRGTYAVASAASAQASSATAASPFDPREVMPA